ncbi:hypothetical protein ACIBCC_19210 [Streptomyces griseus]|uniref:hypothetical protein n=1 Tax=Streptomyces griseus TaxID=1911 RepID=UPI0037992BA5
MTVDEFLRARYAEGAEAVRAHWNAAGITSRRFHGTPMDPPALIADLEMKLAIVDEHSLVPASYGQSLGCEICVATFSWGG